MQIQQRTLQAVNVTRSQNNLFITRRERTKISSNFWTQLHSRSSPDLVWVDRQLWKEVFGSFVEIFLIYFFLVKRNSFGFSCWIIGGWCEEINRERRLLCSQMSFLKSALCRAFISCAIRRNHSRPAFSFQTTTSTCAFGNVLHIKPFTLNPEGHQNSNDGI